MIKWEPFNGLGYSPFMTGFFNGGYQANLIFLPVAIVTIFFFSKIIALVCLIVYLVCMGVINFWE